MKTLILTALLALTAASLTDSVSFGVVLAALICAGFVIPGHVDAGSADRASAPLAGRGGDRD